MSSQLILLRKCIHCGLEANTTEDLELFCKDKLYRYGRMNRCKKCRNQQNRDPLRGKLTRDRLSKKWNPINNLRRIKFLGKSILLKENPRTGVCTNCGRKYPGELKRQTSMHHETYDRQNPLEHTVELCVSCHNKLRNSKARVG